MKFKTKEDLIKEIDVAIPNYDIAYIRGIEDAFKSFAERVEFYKKYHIFYEILRQDHPEVTEIFDKKFGFTKEELKSFKPDSLGYRVFENTYRSWLFDFCFGDGIE